MHGYSVVGFTDGKMVVCRQQVTLSITPNIHVRLYPFSYLRILYHALYSLEINSFGAHLGVTVSQRSKQGRPRRHPS